MDKQLHIWLERPKDNFLVYIDVLSTERAMNEEFNHIHTTQTHFLQFRYGYRLFVHVYEDDYFGHEITLGNCVGTNREIKKSHNIEKMLFAGEFEWY